MDHFISYLKPYRWVQIVRFLLVYLVNRIINVKYQNVKLLKLREKKCLISYKIIGVWEQYLESFNSVK